MSVTVGTVLKKVAEVLVSSKSGRKFIGYTVGITLFLVLLPMIVIVGLFGWMAGDSGSILNQDDILVNIPNEQLVQIQTIDQVSDTIVTTFEDAGLDESYHKKAIAIYMGYLVGMETQDAFYENLVNCFLNTSEDADVYDLISQTFLVVVSEDDQTKFDSLYGVTPTRVEEEKEE